MKCKTDTKPNEAQELFGQVKLLMSLIRSLSPKYYPVLFFVSAMESAYPFINIIFSYLILDGLVEKLLVETILSYVFWMAGLNLFFSVAKQLIKKWVEVEEDVLTIKLDARMGEHGLSMDFEQLEKLESQEMLRKAAEGATAWGGILGFCHHLSDMLKNILSGVYAIVLLTPLFFTQAQPGTGFLNQVLASPFSNFLIAGIFFISLFLNSRIFKKLNQVIKRFSDAILDGNRTFKYFSELSQDYKMGKDIRCYRMDILIVQMWNKLQIKTYGLFWKAGKAQGIYFGLSNILDQLSVFLFYGFIGAKAIVGAISIGSVLKFVSSLSQLSTAISELTNHISSLSIQVHCAVNYPNFLALENVKYQGQLPIEKRNDNQYEIEFKDVSFHYPDNDEMILDHISFRFKIGDKYAIVGPNGAGKTTFIKLLCRLYDPTEGQILLNGIDIKKYDYNEYLQLFSVVFQDFKLFSFDIAQNVAANTVYNEQKIWDCLDQAGVGDRVRKMEDKLLSKLYQSDSSGVEISGGEAQKIAIARALYKDAPFVILDEPTSALDPISEYEIYSKFDTLVSDKTAIYISHRMSSCRFCDNIVVFEKGKIVQTGSHETLLRNEKGMYYHLWSSQAKYYTDAEAAC